MKQLALLVLLGVAASAFAVAPLHRVTGPVKDRYLVLLHKDSPADAHAETLARGANAKVVHVYTTVLNGFSIQATEQAAQALTNKPNVESVWEVPTVKVTDVQTSPRPPQGIDRIDQRTSPLDGSYTYTMYTTPVTNIYITDTGVDPRADFGNRLIENINWTTTQNGSRNHADYTDFGLPLNDRWHGTSTAVIAAGKDYGVAKWAKLINVRVIGSDFGTYDDVVAGINWVTERAKARTNERHVANASWAGTVIYPPAEDALRRSVADGVAWVFSAGNDAATACNYSPARLGRELSGALTVGAMYPWNDRVTEYSNQGPCVEIYAPADVAWGTDADTGGTVAAGTSAAAPHVAGVYAIRLASSTGTAAEIEGYLKGLATTNVLSNLWTDSQNLLLYSLRPKTRACCS